MRKCRFRQTTVEYEILSLMLPSTTTPTIARHSSLRFVYRQSTQSKFIFEYLREINENQMENRAMKCLHNIEDLRFCDMRGRLIGLQKCYTRKVSICKTNLESQHLSSLTSSHIILQINIINRILFMYYKRIILNNILQSIPELVNYKYDNR